MRIKEILTQHRRDFTAIYVCEHCGHEEKANGYDDSYFHTTVIPQLQCSKCGEVSPQDYVPKQPKYPDDFQI